MSHYCPENSSNHSDLSSRTDRRVASADALKKLYIAIALCSVFMIVETFGGIMANSLAIITDAVHLLSGNIYSIHKK
jgi:zinc transporter 2